MSNPHYKTFTLLACDTALTIGGTSRECDPDYWASNVTGATWTITGSTITNGMAHQISLRNDTATDHSAKTVIFTGKFGIYPISETINMPAGNATVKTTKYFSELTSAVPSATIGADTMDIGICEISSSVLIKGNYKGLNEGICITITNKTAINYTLQFTRSKIEPDNPNHRTNPYTDLYDSWNWLDHDDTALVNATGNVSSNTQEPPTAYRLILNSYTQSSTPTIDFEKTQLLNI